MTDFVPSKAPTPGGLPHDIREILPLETPWWHYGLWALAAVVIVALIAWGISKLNGWLARREARPAPADPWDALRARLQALSPSEPFEGKRAGDFFYEVSFCVRLAIERRTGLPATYRTTQELRGLFDRLPLSPEAIKEMRGFFERADMVKFANARTTVAEALAARDQALAWIDGLRPFSIHVEGTPDKAMSGWDPRENPLDVGRKEVGRGSG